MWYEFLSSYSIRFQRQKAIGNYIVDFYCARAGVVIELDGSGHYQDAQEEKDCIRTLELENMNLCVLRFSNLDIDRNFKAVCESIDRSVKAILQAKGSL